jgi:hypothetical protein
MCKRWDFTVFSLLLGYFLVCVAGYHGPGDLDLSRCQAEGLAAAPGALELPQAHDRVRHSLTADPEIAGHDGVDALEEHLRAGVLQNDPARAKL